MTKNNRLFWDNRFSSEEYIYGKEPNEYLKEQLTNLKPGRILFAAEGFSESHQTQQKENPKAGGPKNKEMLYNLEELKEDFKDFEFILFEETTTELNEGDYHVGKANVIRILAKK